MASLKRNSKASSFKALKDAAKDAKMHQGEHDYFAFYKVGIPIITIIVIFIVGLIMSVSSDSSIAEAGEGVLLGAIEGLLDSVKDWLKELLILLLIALVLWIISLFIKKK